MDDEAHRVRVGSSASASPRDLARLAHDASVTVRAALALNPRAPHSANVTLSHDPDERVRVLLARKLGGLIPTLSEPTQVHVRDLAWDMLTQLVEDEAVRVRAAIAEEVKGLPDAPRMLILRLAEDQAVMVHEPVILFSPLLTPEDLIALVACAPSPETVTCVARRPNLDPSVCDAVAETAGEDAICALLKNPSAQIREMTLDHLTGQAATHTSWQEALARRAVLPPRSAARLAEIVTGHLLDELAARADLDPDLSQCLRSRLAERLRPMADPETDRRQVALTRARNLAREGLLTEAALLAATRQGDVTLTAALLAEKADVPIALVERAALLRNAKGLVGLTWKAGFSMRAAMAVQSTLARLPPDATLAPGPDGGFPMAVDEMRWQVDFLGGGGTAPAARVSGGSAYPARPR
ncbi:MAG: DUF2336 domain-containing protein [Acetobacteraceae bacterium]